MYEKGTPRQRQMDQNALDRWWWPSLMMFGPPDDDSPNSATLMRWGIKLRSNDTLRQEFIDEIVPELHAAGLRIPDPDLRYDEESGHWHTGPINWDEFWRVIQGGGLMNHERLRARREAHEDGLWVREAMAAYAERQAVADIQ